MSVHLPIRGISLPCPRLVAPLSKKVKLVKFSNGTYGIRFGIFFYRYLDLTTGNTKSTCTKSSINFEDTCTSQQYGEVLKLFNTIMSENSDSTLTDEVIL